MKASDLLHAKTMRLCEQNLGMEYSDALTRVLRDDPKLREAYCRDLETVPGTERFAQAEPQLPPWSLAGLRVTERVAALEESRKADGLPELDYQTMLSQVLRDYPELARAYTGSEV